MLYSSKRDIQLTDWDDIESPTDGTPTNQALAPLPSSRSEFAKAQEREIRGALDAIENHASASLYGVPEHTYPRWKARLEENRPLGFQKNQIHIGGEVIDIMESPFCPPDRVIMLNSRRAGKTIALTKEAERFKGTTGTFDAALKKMYAGSMTELMPSVFPLFNKLRSDIQARADWEQQKDQRPITLKDMNRAFDKVSQHGNKPDSVWMHPSSYRDMKSHFEFHEYGDLLAEMIRLEMEKGIEYADASRAAEERLIELLKVKSW